MKKTLLTLGAVVGLGFGALAQGPGSTAWISQNIGISGTNKIVRDIEIPSANVTWAVLRDNNVGAPPIQEFSRTLDGGTTWIPGSVGAVGATLEFANISALNGDTAWVAMYHGTNGGGKILRTNDGGATWTHQSTATFTASAGGFPNVVHMYNANNGWAQGDPTGGYYEIYTTTNGGTTWVRVPSANIPAPLPGEYGIVNMYSTVGTDTIFFGTNMGRVYKSVNGGLNWTVATTGLASMEDVVFANGNYGLVRNAADLRKTTDGGLTWQLVPYGGSGTFHQSDLEYVPGTNQTFVSGGSRGQSFGTSYSLDGGHTWTDLDSNFGRPTLKFLNPTVGYAGGFTSATGDGIFKYSGIVNLAATTTPPATPTITPGGPSTFCGSGLLTAASATPNVTYQWFNNGTAITGASAATYNATATGNYTVTALSGSLSSTASTATVVTVNPKPVTPTITKTGNLLTSSATSGTYQWFSVAGTTLTPIAGATSQTFTPANNGNYTVRVTENSCQSDPATTMNVVLGISSLAPGMDVSVYPNPSAGRFTVNLAGFEKEASIQIINITGQVLASEKVVISSDKASKAFDLGDMAKGVYFLKVTSGNNLTFRKVILD